MQIKRGSTYTLLVHLTRESQEIDINEVEKVVFKFNDIEKVYPSADVSHEENNFVISLSQEETLGLKNRKVLWEAGIRYKDGEVKKTLVNEMPTIDTIIEKVI